MPGRKNDTSGRSDTSVDAPAREGSDEQSTRFELTSKLAIAAGPPVPISFRGVPYSVRRGYTSDEVLEFFDLSREGRYDKILELLISDGDPAELWAEFKERSVPEFMKVYLPAIYRAAGLMNAQGEFLAL